MPLTTNQMHFFISYAVAFLIFGLIAKWYIWPEIKDRGREARAYAAPALRVSAR
jgi:hypothetical protein